MITKTPTSWGGDITISYDGSTITDQIAAMDLYKLIDVDLRPDAVASPNKLCTLPFIMTPCDNVSGCRYGTITAPASVIIHLVQEVMQVELEKVYASLKVPQTGIYDCKTAAAMVAAHQMITKEGLGAEAKGWPLDMKDLKTILNISNTLFLLIQQMYEATKDQYTAVGSFDGFNLVLPDEATAGIKFFRAEVPAECTAVAKKTNWGLIAGVGIAVVGIAGATYAITQRGKKAKLGSPRL